MKTGMTTTLHELIRQSFFQVKATTNNDFCAMEKLTLYLKESYHELVKNVSWPTAAQLQESTIVVIVTVVVLTACIFAMDGICSMLIKKGIYGL